METYPLTTCTMPPKKHRKRSDSIGSSSTDEDGHPRDTSTVWKLHAANAKWRHMACFIQGFCVPGTNEPFISNTPLCPGGQFKGEFNEYIDDPDTNLDHMLNFLLDGELDRISKVKSIIDNLNKVDRWELQFLDLLDSDPVPVSQNLEDYDKWCNKKMQSIAALTPEEYYSVKDSCNEIVKFISDLGKEKVTPAQGVNDSDSSHTKWRKIVQTLLHILTPVFTDIMMHHSGMKGIQASYKRKGDIKDKIRFMKFVNAGDTYFTKNSKSGLTHREHEEVAILDCAQGYRVIVEPDVVIQTLIKEPTDGTIHKLTSLTIEIGSQCANPNHLFLTKPSESELSTTGLEESMSYKMEMESDSGSHISRPSKQSKSGGSNSGQLTTKMSEKFSKVGEKVKSQHLLELIASAKQNVEILDEIQSKRRLSWQKGIFKTTAGMLWFHNGVYLTRLDAIIGRLDGYQHRKCGKYILCEKYLTPWKGHWKSIAYYWFACSLAFHIFDDPYDRT